MSQLHGLLSCEFVHSPSADCAHRDQPLFASEYKRTNRTRASKIVRCFPHCCPQHRARSYCGSAIQVEVAVHNEVALHDVLVFGRFEERDPDNGTETSAQHLEVGQVVPSREILESSGSVSVWVKGILAPSTTNNGGTDQDEHSKLYVLRGSDDGFGHWEYDWKSGTSQRHRMMQHHFRVYVFAPADSDNTEWKVVGMATSTPFTFAVYRKHQHDPSILTATDTAGANQDADVDGGLSDNDGHVHIVEDVSLDDASQDVLWHVRHRSLAKTSTNLAILDALINTLDPRCILRYSRELFATLQASLSSLDDGGAPEHLLLHYVNHCIPQLLALFPTRQPGRTTSLDIDGEYGQRAALWAELVASMLDATQLRSNLALIGSYASLPSLTTLSRRAVFVQWLDVVSGQVESFLQQRGHSTDLVVDDVVTFGLHHASPASQVRLRTLLRNTRVLGQPLFDYLFDKLRGDYEHEEVSTLQRDTSSLFCGRWICRSVESDEQPLTEPSPHRRGSWPQVRPRHPKPPLPPTSTLSVDMASTIVMIFTVLGFDIEVFEEAAGESATVQLKLCPLSSVSSESSTRFVLDGVFHHAALAMPVPLGSLLATSASWHRVFYRGKDRKQLVAPNEMQLELLLVGGSRSQERLRRITIGFVLPPSDERGRQRQRLHLHVSVEDDTQSTLAPRQQVSSASGSSDDESSDSNNETTDDSHPSGADIDAGSSSHGVLMAADSCIESQYDRVKYWHRHLSFRATYLALE